MHMHAFKINFLVYFLTLEKDAFETGIITRYTEENSNLFNNNF